MMEKIRIVIGDYQVAFARFDVYSAAEFRSRLAGGIDDKTRGEDGAVGETRDAFADCSDWAAVNDASAEVASLLQQECGGTGRVNDGISRHAKPACQRRAQVGLRLTNLLRIENFGVYAAFAVIVKFSMDFGHFGFIGGDPQSSTRVKLDGGGKLLAHIVPKNLGVTRDRELRLGIVHYDDVAHGCASGARAGKAFVNHQDPQAFGREFQSARGANNAGADDHNFSRLVHG